MEVKEYLTALEQGLEKKEKILDAILDKCKEQKLMLQDENLTPESLDANIAEKAALIEELNKLDAGFEQVFSRIKEELDGNRTQYAAQIRTMQQKISDIMAKSTAVQVEERRNKELASVKFSRIRKQIREVKSSQKAVNQYYQNMMKLNYVDPQFLDNKK